MKRLLLLLLWIPSAIFGVQVMASSSKPVVLQIAPLGTQLTDDLLGVAQDLKRCFAFTKQFEVAIAARQANPTKEQLKNLKKEHNVLLLITLASTANGFEWRLYDTISKKLMAGHPYEKKGDLRHAWAYNIADEIWPLLANQEGFFSTKIAFCKRLEGKRAKHIFIADFDGSHQQAIVDTPTINIAPRWNHDRKNPLLFFSDYTKHNVRLRVTRLDKKARDASNFEGINMIPSFSKDGTKMVYCSSRGDGSCQIYYCQKDTFKNITHNMGNNVSPSLSDDGKKVFFCSDFETQRPQIYCYDLESKKQERLTSGGYCASPRYCPGSQKLVYAKMLAGVMQLFLYDLETKQEEQLTFDYATKQECCWSPCGNWLIYAYNEPRKPGRIAIMNRHSKKQQFLTPAGVDCSYPDWAPRYNEFPVLKA